MKYVVISNGDIKDYNEIKHYTKGGIIICCDGGLRHCYNMGLMPKHIIGDFDSANPEHISYYKSKGIDFISYPTEKDTSDTEIGVQLAIDEGAAEICMIGATGTRLDHTLANIQLLITCMNNGIQAELVDNHNIMAVTKDKILLKGKAGDLVSAIPMTEHVKGISNRGLQYVLKDYNMELGYNCGRGVSNVMIGNEAEISIKEGILLVVKARD